MLLTRKGLLWSLSWTFKLLTSNLCVKWLFHTEGYYTSLSASAFSRASNTSLAGNWCLMLWKRSKTARGWGLKKACLPFFCWSVNEVPYFLIAWLHLNSIQMWKRGLCLVGQERDILSYFYHHLFYAVYHANIQLLQAGGVFMIVPQSWNPAVLALHVMMCWLSVRERSLPWGTCLECAEHEGPHWHAWCPF